MLHDTQAPLISLQAIRTSKHHPPGNFRTHSCPFPRPTAQLIRTNSGNVQMHSMFPANAHCWVRIHPVNMRRVAGLGDRPRFRPRPDGRTLRWESGTLKIRTGNDPSVCFVYYGGLGWGQKGDMGGSRRWWGLGTCDPRPARTCILISGEGKGKSEGK